MGSSTEMRRHYGHWDEDTQTLIDAWAKRTIPVDQFNDDMAKQLGRTARSVSLRREQLKLLSRTVRPWSPEDDAVVSAGHEGGDAAIAEQLGRTPHAISQRRAVLRRAGIECAIRTRIERPTPAAMAQEPKQVPIDPAHSRLPADWFGPPGSGHGPGDVWVPGKAFRRSA